MKLFRFQKRGRLEFWDQSNGFAPTRALDLFKLMRAKLIFLRNSMLTWYQLPTSLMSIDVWVSLQRTSSTCKTRVAMRLVLLAGLKRTGPNYLVITVIPAINAF